MDPSPFFRRLAVAFSARIPQATNEEGPLLEHADDFDAFPGARASRVAFYKRRTSYYIPIFSWLPSYSFDLLIGDVVGGVSLASVLVPQALAFAALAGIPPKYGLYSAIAPVLGYMLFGQSRQLSIGPEATVAILLNSMMAMDAPEHVRVAIVTSAACFIGLTLFVLGLFRFGFLQNILSNAILSGFVIGVVVLVACNELELLLGLPHSHLEAYEKIPHVINTIGDTNLVDLALSCGTVVALVGSRAAKAWAASNVSPRFLLIPELFVVVCCAIILTYHLDLRSHGVTVFHAERTGPPSFQLPDFKAVPEPTDLLKTSMVLAIVGFVESSLISQTYSRIHQYPVSANRELVALGLANVCGAVFGAMPTFGSLGRSRVGNVAGVKTQGAGFFAAACVMLSAIYLTPAFAYLPQSVMAAVITAVVLGLLAKELHELWFLITIKAYQDVGLLLAAAASTVVMGIENTIVICVGVSLLLVVKTTTAPKMAVLGELPDGSFRDIITYPKAEIDPSMVVVKVACDTLYFANVKVVREMLLRCEAPGGLYIHPSDRELVGVSPSLPVECIIIDLSSLHGIDGSAMVVFKEIIEDYVHQRHLQCIIVGLRKGLQKSFTAAGIQTLAGEQCFVEDVSTAVSTLRRRRESLGPHKMPV